MVLHQFQATERLPLSVWEQVCGSVLAALPTGTRDSTTQKVWVHVEGFVIKKQPKLVRSSSELSPPEVLCADKWRL